MNKPIYSLCDSDSCPNSSNPLSTIIRIIPVDNSTNVHLCEDCYNAETKLSLVSIPFSIFPCLHAELEKLGYTSDPTPLESQYEESIF